MARVLLALGLSLLGACALGLSVFGCATVGGVRAETSGPTHMLRRTNGADTTTYSRTQTVRVLGDGFSFQLTASSVVVVRPFDGGRLLVHETFEAPTYSQDGSAAPTPPGAAQLTGVQTRSVIDSQSRFLEGPELTARRDAGAVIEGALVAIGRGLHLTYPAGPVAVGEGWDREPMRVSVESPIAMSVTIATSFVLAAVENEEDGPGTALIEWEGHVRVPAFDAMGMTLEGRGTIFGVSRIALADGSVGVTDLDVRFSVGPRSSSDVLTLLSATLKYRDEHELVDDAVRRLVDGVRPIDPRG